MTPVICSIQRTRRGSHLYSKCLPIFSVISSWPQSQRENLSYYSRPTGCHIKDFKVYPTQNYHSLSNQSLLRDPLPLSDFSPHHRRILSRKDDKNNKKECQRYFCEQRNLNFKQGSLEGVKDRFNGVWVDLSHSMSAQGTTIKTDALFDTLLSNSLKLWRCENVSSVWLKVPIGLSYLINVASQYNFEYHHAEGKMAVLVLWMKEDVESRIPRFATHQIGVSGVVINEKNHEVLVVKDKNKKRKLWKFPGGLSDLGEDIEDTAVREVLEETGILTEFKSILAFRQHHDLPNAFGRSDVYILCRLKPLSFDLHPCAEEIEAVQWMSLEELLGQRDTSIFSRRIVKLVKMGLEHGFHTVDITSNSTESIYQNTTFQLFHRSLDGEDHL